MKTQPQKKDNDTPPVGDAAKAKVGMSVRADNGAENAVTLGGDEKPKSVLRCGDTLSVLSELDDSSCDLILTDPPYNLGLFMKKRGTNIGKLRANHFAVASWDLRGIPSDMLAHILDPFVQVHAPSHSADRTIGTGLGLSICRSLVEMMGGELVVESELGKGSTFRAAIPGVELVEENTAAVPEQKVTVDLKNLPKRVLVVDDSRVNRAVLTAFLKKVGVASIKQAVDGGEALSELDSAFKAGSPFDFVFSDFWMPNMNGLELVEKLRADSRFKRLSVFALTADTETNQDARSKLFTGILLKPITYNNLVTAFASAS